MKKTLLILSIITLIFAGCKKFDEIEASKVKIVEEKIEKGWDCIKINVEYDYPVELEAVTLYLSEKEDMSGAEVYECNVEGNKFSVSIDNVNFEKIYYCYEYDNGYEKEKSEVGRNYNYYYGHECVDLGLPSGLKWATCNVGATSPENYGDYFAWGETSLKEEYTEENSLTYGKDMSDIAGNTQYDAATANWGGTWRMPTNSEIKELIDNCTWTWTTQNGINGYKVTSKVNSNYIFLPAAGYRYRSSLCSARSDGSYWSSSSPGSGDNYAYYLNFYSVNQYMSINYRNYGRSVRPVVE